MTPDEITAVKVGHSGRHMCSALVWHPQREGIEHPEGCEPYLLAVEVERLVGKVADAERRASGWQRTAEIRARGWDAVSAERKILAGKVARVEALAPSGRVGVVTFAKVHAALADQPEQMQP